MKKIMSILKKRLMYPKNMKEEIITHEDKMFELYSNIIHETYDDFFKNYGGEIIVEKRWQYKFSDNSYYKRIPMIWGYIGYIECQVYRNGESYLVNFPADYESRVLFTLWDISKVMEPWREKPYILKSDINIIHTKMKEFMELILKGKKCIGEYIKKHLDNWNPLELSLTVIDDGYSKISEEIANEYYEDDELGNIIFEKFCSLYGTEKFTKSIEKCKEIAKDILNDYQVDW